MFTLAIFGCSLFWTMFFANDQFGLSDHGQSECDALRFHCYERLDLEEEARLLQRRPLGTVEMLGGCLGSPPKLWLLQFSVEYIFMCVCVFLTDPFCACVCGFKGKPKGHQTMVPLYMNASMRGRSCVALLVGVRKNVALVR